MRSPWSYSPPRFSLRGRPYFNLLPSPIPAPLLSLEILTPCIPIGKHHSPFLWRAWMRNEGETPGPGADGQERCDCISRLIDEQLMGKHWRKNTRAAIQRGGPIIGMDRNFVNLWRRHNCKWSLPFCADLLVYEINYCVFKQFLFTYNNFYIINK